MLSPGLQILPRPNLIPAGEGEKDLYDIFTKRG